MNVCVPKLGFLKRLSLRGILYLASRQPICSHCDLWMLSSSKHLAVQLWLKLHCHEFLQEEFACVRDLNLADVFSWVASFTVIFELVKIGLTEKTAFLAHMDPVAIRNIKQTFFQETCRSMWYHTITLHFSKAETAVAGPTLSWLSCQDLSWTTTSWMDLVSYHVL